MIPENIQILRDRIVRACQRVGRDPSEVTLVGVSKTFSENQIAKALDAGLADIGENYVQELLGKRDSLASRDVRWHFIGHLQTNKVKYLVGWIHLIHTLDNPGLAAEIDKRAGQAGRVIDVLVEVNTTGEQTKFGLQPDSVVEFVRTLSDFSSINITGLMTIGPFLPDPEGSRPMFRQLRQLREALTRLGQRNVAMRHLSMGMTGDFEVAIEEGATLVRVGTALFGARVKKS